jgi:predicted phosphodiesterase
MKIGILGDIHGNLDALTAVVEVLQRENVDVWVQVGDIVGYGPEPSACIDLVRQLGCVTCLGNHDAAVLGLLDTSYFNNFARAAIHWTAPQLRPSDYEFLNSLQHVEEREEFTVVHGSMHMPEQFGYVVSVVEALESFAHQRTRLCFVGHSHVPATYMRREESPRDIHVVPHSEAETSDTDLELASIRRVSYDVERVQAKIRAAGLPDVLANRLALGV